MLPFHSLAPLAAFGAAALGFVLKAQTDRQSGSGVQQQDKGGGMAPPKATAEHAKLQKMVGEWDATVTTSMGAGQPSNTSKARAVFKPIGDKWVVCDFTGDMLGTPYVGHGADGYDTQKKKFVSLWLDSWSTEYMALEGTHDAASHQTTLTGPGRDHKTGKQIQFRTVSEMKDNDSMIFRMYRPGDDGKDFETMRIDYKRRK